MFIECNAMYTSPFHNVRNNFTLSQTCNFNVVVVVICLCILIVIRFSLRKSAEDDCDVHQSESI